MHLPRLNILGLMKKTKNLACGKVEQVKKGNFVGDGVSMVGGVFDCAIVGAGPAGAAAALMLARTGCRVGILEKERLPRYKPCGGGVSPEVFALLGIDPSPDAGVVTRATEAEILFDGERPFLCRLPVPCPLVDRYRFDHHLVSLAAAAGADVRDGTEVRGFRDGDASVEIETGKGRVSARFVIIADGGQGRMAKEAGFPAKKSGVEGVAVGGEVPWSGNGRMVVDLGIMPCGYAWLFPKGDRASIGLGITKRGGNHRIIFEKLRLFAERMEVPFERAIVRGACLGLWHKGRPAAVRGRFLLAGDAARLVDPLSAEGIRPAVKSALMAAAAVERALDGDDTTLDGYEKELREAFDRHYAIAAKIAHFFFLFPALSYRAVFSYPQIGTLMGQMFLGDRGYGDIAEKAIAFLRRKVFFRAHEQ